VKPRLAIAVLAVLLTTACTGNASTKSPADPSNKAQSAETRAWQEFNEASDLPAVALRPTRLPKVPQGFTRPEQQFFASELVDLAQRSIDPALSALPAGAAVDEVLSVVEPLTREDYRKRNQQKKGGAQVGWHLASRFAPEPTVPPRVVKVSWRSRSFPGRLEDGTVERYLTVWLQVHVRQEVETPDGPRAIVVQRTLSLSGFRPLTTAAGWSPGMGVSIRVWGVDACSVLDRSLFRPSSDVDDVQDSVKPVEKALSSKVFENSSESEDTTKRQMGCEQEAA
jgi:hypothetical protein